jgi:hypothetical protein
MALLHYPVVNKRGEVIASAITNLDLHDMARTARTYGVKSLFVVTPLQDQKSLIEKIVSHWLIGVGATYNPIRKEALELIQVRDSLEGVIASFPDTISEKKPKIVVTSARAYPQSINYVEFRNLLMADDSPFILCFGTAWGLSEEFIVHADYVLDPIRGNSDYNHLPVRAAAAIILDRLVGEG